MTPAAVVLILAVTLQDPGEPPQEPDVEEGAWEMFYRARGVLEYTDNAFLLSPKTIERKEEERAADEISGRFDDMNEIEDVIFTPGFRLGGKGPGLGDQPMEASIDLELALYSQNPTRSHVQLEGWVRQQVSEGGRVQLSMRLVPHYFHRNSLHTYEDLNFNGSVNSSERRYKPEYYTDWETELQYRQKWKFGEKGARGSFEAAMNVGTQLRFYEAPFEGRNETQLWLRPALESELWGWLRLEASYEFGIHDNDPHEQLQLYDEPELGIDLNMDFDTVDTNVPITLPVDRSAVHHEFALLVGAELTKGFTVDATYSRRIKDFDSDLTLDLSHQDRRDERNSFGVKVRYEPKGPWSFAAGFKYSKQTTDRQNDPDNPGETVDFRERSYVVDVSYSW